jgi:hypothetical protein
LKGDNKKFVIVDDVKSPGPAQPNSGERLTESAPNCHCAIDRLVRPIEKTGQSEEKRPEPEGGGAIRPLIIPLIDYPPLSKELR